MTRLCANWIDNMENEMNSYNKELKRKTGLDLTELMKISCGLTDDKIIDAKEKIKVSVVPITQGKGIISKFSESVASIVRTAGFDVSITDQTDVDGMYHAVKNGTDVIFMADDDRYIALNVKNGKIGDNNYCTALGYIEVLLKMMNEPSDVLMIGYGVLGHEALGILNGRGIKPYVYDKRPIGLEDGMSGVISEREIKNFKYVLDYTNEGGWLKKDILNKEVIYASPGVPLSLDDEAGELHYERAVFDLLEIGTVVMLGSVI